MTETNLVFYGVRGSYPVPNKSVSKYGGNTAAILIERNDKILILDAGTGIFNIGSYLKESKPHIKKADLFLTHLHIDHIQGIPSFAPVFDKEFELNIYCDNSKNFSFKDTVYTLFNQPLSPIGNKGIKARINFIPLIPEEPETITIDAGLSVDFMKENSHPHAGVLIYRINVENSHILYATDVESPCGFEKKYLEFIKGADILIHDSQYFDADYYSNENSKKGFGHSTVSMAAANAIKCEVKKLFLFHYSHRYSDKDVEKMLKEARKKFKNTFLSEELKKIKLRR
jgi:ribonuclease BN (tRNA processing enzyme)